MQEEEKNLKKTEKLFLTEESALVHKVFEFPWALMFDDLKVGGLFSILFPYIVCILLIIVILITALK